MRQGITTRYLGPTNARGSRIKAIARKGNQGLGWPEMALIQSYKHRGIEEEHASAALALATRLGWSGLWIGGGKPEEDGYMFVNLGLRPPFAQRWQRSEDMWKALGKEGSDWFHVPDNTVTEAPPSPTIPGADLEAGPAVFFTGQYA